MTKVTGETKLSPVEPQNPGAYNEMLRSIGIDPVIDAWGRAVQPTPENAGASEE